MDIGIQIVILTLVLILLIGFLIWFLNHAEKKKSVMDLFNPRKGKNDFINKDLEIKSIGGYTSMFSLEGAPANIPRFIDCFAKHFMTLNTGIENDRLINEFIDSTNENVRSTSLRLKQAYEDVQGDEKIPKHFRYVLMNVLPEVFVVGEWKYNFHIKNLQLAGGGTFNTVFFIDIYKNSAVLQQKSVLRIYNQNLAHQDKKHQNLLNDIRNLYKMFGDSNLVRLPIFSSIDANHEYRVRHGDDYYAVVWQVLPSMNPLPTTLNLNQTRNYINVIYGVLKRLHENYLIYIDWKRDNAMCLGDDILLTDTEFLSAYGGMENLFITQCMPKYFKKNLDKYKLNQFQNIDMELMVLDNHIGIREMVLALISMTGYFEDKANYDKLIGERWYKHPMDIENQEYNKFISSICDILNKNWTTDDECLDFIFMYINEFLDIIERMDVRNEEFRRLVDDLIERNQQEVIKMQKSFALRHSNESWPKVIPGPNSNRTPGSSPVSNNMNLNPPSPMYNSPLSRGFSPKKQPNDNFNAQPMNTMNLLSPMSPYSRNRKSVKSKEEEETIEMDGLNFDDE